MNPDPGESQKDTDPMDPDPAPDPQHWLKVVCNEKGGGGKWQTFAIGLGLVWFGLAVFLEKLGQGGVDLSQLLLLVIHLSCGDQPTGFFPTAF
jgi:hypothetical protein